MNKGTELKGRLDRIGKTSLEHFQDIKELEVADEQGLTVENLLPYKCKQVEKSLKAFEIIKEKRVACDLFYIFLKKGLPYEKYFCNYSTYGDGILSPEEFDLLKEVLE